MIYCAKGVRLLRGRASNKRFGDCGKGTGRFFKINVAYCMPRASSRKGSQPPRTSETSLALKKRTTAKVGISQLQPGD
ncbi:hypothetical protein GJAV_G00255410 [Gymnothorax javanicus]|nr:hypothetical protein GJAV_G00255410 [Gymnothorax javanicus]